MPCFASLMFAAAAVATAAPIPPDTDILDTARDPVMRMTVPTQVNGQGPFAFTIDTGADRSVVSDRLAAALALPPGGNILVHGLVGADRIATVRLDRLKVGRSETRDVFVPVFPEQALGATGFLGIDALRSSNVVLDFRRYTITLSPSRDRADSEPGTIVVTGRSRFGQLILTDARVKGRKVYAIIDTGAQNTIGNMALRQLLRGDAPFAPGEDRLIGVTGSRIPAEYGSVPRIRLGGLEIAGMPIAYAAAHTFAKFGVDKVPAILVGMDVLRSFRRVALDFRRREVRFLVGDQPPAGT